MKEIIPPVERAVIEQELTEEQFIRETNNGHNEIYIVNYHNSPNITREVGRLRELTFRDAGGGTGKDCDLDNYDTKDVPFEQLIVWDPREKEIIGGYRFLDCNKLGQDEHGKVLSPTAKLFHFSEKFINEYLPYTIELGRSFVQPLYQPAYNIRKGMYALDNIWDGLGAIMVDNPEIKYFFGKITMYPHYNLLARDMILYFFEKYFPDEERLVEPYDPVEVKTDRNFLKNIFIGGSYEEDYKILIKNVRSMGEGIPPLVNAYMNLSSTMRSFGTAINAAFGNVEETGIIVTIGDIYDIKKDRHLSTYKGRKNT
ncbi:MAG: GNAT family N-acetyltransferase [Bacteroidales bacterium]|nr:GNAT family N-acetyltransferase [Bacteroidales bacterium]